MMIEDYRYIGIVLLLAAVSAAGEESNRGSISETLRNVPDNTDRRFPYQATMPVQCELRLWNLPLDTIDTIDSAVLLTPGDSRLNLALQKPVSEFSEASTGKMILNFCHTPDFALFDGWQGRVYIHPEGEYRNFARSGIDESATGDVVLGTNSDLGLTYGWGAQGLCGMAPQGVLGRIFWPPLQGRWREAVDMAEKYTGSFSDFPYWDVRAVRFSSHTVLWLGLWGGVCRLDFGNDSYRMLDAEVSPIAPDRVITLIAPLHGTDIVRCLAQEHWSVPDSERRGTGQARVYRIAGDAVEEELLPEEVLRILNDLSVDIHNASGTLWFAGDGMIWRSSTEDTRIVTAYPSGIEKGDHPRLLVDDNGKIWLGGGGNLWMYNGEHWTAVKADFLGIEGYAFTHCLDIGRDPCGRIWISWSYRDVPRSCNDGGLSVIGLKALATLENMR